MKIKGYADGSCKPKTRKGGWGIMMEYENENAIFKWTSYGNKSDTTNQEMELTGFLELLKLIPYCNEIEIYLDSQYVIQGVVRDNKGGIIQKWCNGGWISKWQKNSWITTAKTPVKHYKLWKNIMEMCNKHIDKNSTITLVWVKGHSGIEGNEIVDKLANKAVEDN